jgi:hypothetical protein
MITVSFYVNIASNVFLFFPPFFQDKNRKLDQLTNRHRKEEMRKYYKVNIHIF